MKVLFLKSTIANKLLVLLLVLACSTSIAQKIQGGINYQAILRNSSGQVLNSQAVALRITLSQGATEVYKETHQTTSTADGIVNVLIGKGTIQSGSFTSINWSGERINARVELDATGGSNFLLLGNTLLASVPYAYYAEHANLNLLGKGVIIDGNTIIAKDSSATNEIQELVLNGNTLSLTKGNQITLSGLQLPVLTVNQNEFAALSKTQGLQVFNTTDNCLYIFTSATYARKLCGFDCFPGPDQANAGADVSITSSSATLQGNVPSTGSGSWSIVTGTGGTIVNNGNGAATFTGVPPQNYLVRYTITNECGSTFDDKQLTSVSNAISDVDGNIYPVITLGTQTWMQTQLKTTRYADGTSIPQGNMSNPNSDPTNKEAYGLLYTTGPALRDQTTEGVQGACPNGYHIPTKGEMLTLFGYLASHPQTEFVPINAGKGTYPGGPPGYFGQYNALMTSTINSTGNPLYYYHFNSASGDCTLLTTDKGYGINLSIRCIKD